MKKFEQPKKLEINEKKGTKEKEWLEGIRNNEKERKEQPAVEVNSKRSISKFISSDMRTRNGGQNPVLRRIEGGKILFKESSLLEPRLVDKVSRPRNGARVTLRAKESQLLDQWKDLEAKRPNK